MVTFLANYVLVGLFTDEIDQYYITSWKIFVGMAVVFNVLSPMAYAMLRHRLGQQHGLAEARSGRHHDSSNLPAGCQQLDQSQAGDETACHPIGDPLHRPLIRR